MMIMMLTLLLSVAVYGQDAHVMGHVKNEKGELTRGRIAMQPLSTVLRSPVPGSWG